MKARPENIKNALLNSHGLPGHLQGNCCQPNPSLDFMRSHHHMETLSLCMSSVEASTRTIYRMIQGRSVTYTVRGRQGQWTIFGKSAGLCLNLDGQTSTQNRLEIIKAFWKLMKLVFNKFQAPCPSPHGFSSFHLVLKSLLRCGTINIKIRILLSNQESCYCKCFKMVHATHAWANWCPCQSPMLGGQSAPWIYANLEGSCCQPNPRPTWAKRFATPFFLLSWCPLGLGPGQKVRFGLRKLVQQLKREIKQFLNDP